MGPKRKIYMEMLDQGMSYSEIARKCGVTRQNVYSSVKQYGRRCNAPVERKKRYIKGIEKQVIYVGLADYLLDNDLTVTGLSRKCGIDPQTMLRMLRGDQELRKHHIDAILGTTGCTYETLFKEV